MENTTIWKKCKRKYSNSSNKKMSRELKIDFFGQMMKYTFLIHWLIQNLIVIVVGPHH